MTEPQCSEKDNRQQPLTLVSKLRKEVWAPFFLVFCRRICSHHCRTGGDVLSHAERRISGGALLIRGDCNRALINLPAARRPWLCWKLRIKTSSSRQGDEWMEGVIGPQKPETPSPAASLSSPLLFLLLLSLRASGKIKTKWMAAIVMKQLAAKTQDGLKMDVRANERRSKWIPWS